MIQGLKFLKEDFSFGKKKVKRKSFFFVLSLFFLTFYIISIVKIFSEKTYYKRKLGDIRNKHITGAFPSKRKVVILFSNKRSGSSFVGELLNENSNAFYLFEPLFPFTRTCEALQSERVDLLKKLMNCDFTNLQEEYQNAFRVTNHSDKHAKCVRHNLCFQNRHKKLLTKYSEECRRTRQCGSPLASDLLSSICRTSTLVAFKILRICDISTLESLLYQIENRLNMELKFIHLIRDPRAILASRLKLTTDKTNEKNLNSEARLLCERMMKNVDYADKKWKDRKNFFYLRVRLEDLASQSLKNVSKIIYNFIEEKLPYEVNIWLKKMEVDNIHATVDKDPFGMRKRSRDVINSWRRTLEFQEVEGIQEVCGNALNKLGYVIARDESHQHDSSQLF